MDHFERGFDARKEGLPRDSNPHPLQSDAGIAWDTGWSSADADEMMDDLERQADVRQRRGEEVYGATAKKGQWGRAFSSIE